MKTSTHASAMQDGAMRPPGSRVGATAIAMLAAMLFSACGTTHNDANSNTNWMRTCITSSACSPELECICGLCTRSCEAGDECDAERMDGEVRCVSTGDSSLAASCEAEPPAASVCAAHCSETSDCRGLVPGLECMEGICVPALVASGTDGGTDGGQPMDPQACGGTCDMPAGDVRTFATIDDVYAALAGRWRFCDPGGSAFATPPADAIGVEYTPGSSRSRDNGGTVGGAMYYLVEGPAGPERGRGFEYQLTYDVSGSSGAFQLNMHPAPNSGFGGAFRYSPCPTQLEIDGGSANPTGRTVLVAIE